ncbi:MAG: hypothetical protein QXF20_05665 [Candidatus Hadarchaeales archaeon]
MKQRGIAPVLLAVIVGLVVAAVAVVAGTAVLKRGGGETGVPVYSGSKKTPMPPYFVGHLWYMEVEGITIHTYFVEGKTASEILDWYRREMTEKGYENYGVFMGVLPIPPYGSFEWGWMAFRKGNRAVVVGAFSGTTGGQTGCWYAVAEGPLDKLMPPGAPGGGQEQLPGSDQVSGVEPISRYPGSIMLWHETSGPWPDRISIIYGSSENQHRVIGSWFKNQLTGAGWSILDESESGEEVVLWLRKGENEVGLYIYPPDEERAYSRIEVVFDCWRVPAGDLKQARSEPVQRYPGAVVIEYFDMVMAGMKNISISYVSSSGADTVFNWYLSSLPQQGWQILTYSPSERGLSASRGSETLTVNVSPNERQYTEIEVTYWGPA